MARRRYKPTQAPNPPIAVAASYALALRRRLARVEALTLDVLLSGWEKNPNTRIDASAWIQQAIERVRIVTEQTEPAQDLDEQIERIAARVEVSDRLELKRVAGISLANVPGIGAAKSQFREQNVRLIKSLDESRLGELTDVLDEAEKTGLRVEGLRGQIQDRFGVSKSKADLLARDQVLKLNSQVTKLRQQAAGITSYVWSTSRDERVRPGHEDLEGTTQSWDAPPVVDPATGRTAHPGEDYQCRCVAVPVTFLDQPEVDE